MTKALKRFLVTSSLAFIHSSALKRKAAAVSLTPEETHHLRDVLHLKKGSECLLFDREGNECTGRVESFQEDGSAQFQLLEPAVKSSEGVLKLSVAQAIPQDRKMDDIVRKSAELGLLELIPLETERTIVRMSPNQFQKVSIRWERILTQAAKQSRVSRLPRVAPPASFKDLCSRFSSYDRVFILHPDSKAKPIREIEVDNSDHILLVIGPEGGFSDQELKLAQRAEVITMGHEIMRTDTAFVAAASFFKLMGER